MPDKNNDNHKMKHFVFQEYMEKLIIIVPYIYFIYHNSESIFIIMNPISILYLFEMILELFFTLLRFPGKMSHNTTDWILAILGTYAAQIVSTHASNTHLASITFCFILSFIGILVSFSAKICLGRSFAIVAAVRVVKTYGPYRIIRHPMYAGYMLTSFGFLLYNFSLWNICTIFSAWFVQILRIQAEEKILSTDPQWSLWSKHVRWKLLPFIY
ncbi:MAG: isoprenylcysteine carboxylmethyltransferase family protein [Acetobacter lovaniensis]|uniref:methyltransferase family protein n=3 Tax=Acetobacteraceae TaxID=433 RepID=UPI00390961B1|nr:isoprenylcysteine carboxylmethyltransferase family protein [Acetobacter lovaniensis]